MAFAITIREALKVEGNPRSLKIGLVISSYSHVAEIPNVDGGGKFLFFVSNNTANFIYVVAPEYALLESVPRPARKRVRLKPQSGSGPIQMMLPPPHWVTG